MVFSVSLSVILLQQVSVALVLLTYSVRDGDWDHPNGSTTYCFSPLSCLWATFPIREHICAMSKGTVT